MAAEALDVIVASAARHRVGASTIGVAVALALCGCASSARVPDADEQAIATTIVVAESTSTSEGDGVIFTVPTTLAPTVPTTAAPRTTTTLATGLPSAFPIPPASTITLGGGSQMTNGVHIRGVAKPEILRWLRDGLARIGWQIVRDDGTRVDFVGPGAIGAAAVDAPQRGVTLVRFALGGR